MYSNTATATVAMAISASAGLVQGVSVESDLPPSAMASTPSMAASTISTHFLKSTDSHAQPPVPNSDLPSAQIAYGYGRGYKAGGKGAYDDPRCMATAPGEFNKCEIFYDRYTQKHLIFEDTCAPCISDWSNGKAHIDICTQSSSQSGGQAQIDCESRLAPDRGHSVIRDCY